VKLSGTFIKKILRLLIAVQYLPPLCGSSLLECQQLTRGKMRAVCLKDDGTGDGTLHTLCEWATAHPVQSGA